MAAKKDLNLKMWNAANKGDVKTVRAYLDSGADPDFIKPAKGEYEDEGAALHMCGDKGHHEVAALLMQHNADVNVRDGDLWTPLHYCARRDQTQVAQLLVDHGADIELPNTHDERPLHVAAAESSAVTRLLVDKGAEINAAGWSQKTPLHCSVVEGNVAAVRVILGCSRFTALLAKDAYGDTALDEARRKGKQEIRTLMEEAASGGGASAAPPTASTSALPHTSAREKDLEEELRQMKLQFEEERKDKERLKREHVKEKDRLQTRLVQKSGIESAVYELPAKSPGRLVIFANSEFERWGRREGTEADIARLRAVFKPLGFTVLIQEDLTAEAMRMELQDLAGARQQARFGSIIVVVLSHGDNRGVLGVDGKPVPDSAFFNTVGASKILQGKPKVFFLQACRGSREQGDQDTWTNDFINDDTEVSSGSLSVGHDMLVVKSSIPEHVSKRHQTKGSLFVQQLCDVVEEEGRVKHVEDMMKSLTQRMVAVGEKEGFGACPSISHNALTKRFFLIPRH